MAVTEGSEVVGAEAGKTKMLKNWEAGVFQGSHLPGPPALVPCLSTGHGGLECGLPGQGHRCWRF